jgi:hypothetical protein
LEQITKRTSKIIGLEIPLFYFKSWHVYTKWIFQYIEPSNHPCSLTVKQKWNPEFLK